MEKQKKEAFFGWKLYYYKRTAKKEAFLTLYKNFNITEKKNLKIYENGKKWV